MNHSTAQEGSKVEAELAWAHDGSTALNGGSPKMPARRAFDPTKRARQSELEEAIKNEMVRAEARIRQQTGSRYDDIKVSSSVRTTIKSGEGITLVYDALIDRILSPQGACETQTAIRGAVQSRYESNAVPKDWTKPLPDWAIKKTSVRILSCAVPFNSIKLVSGMSLRDLHHQASAVWAGRENGAVRFHAEIDIGADKIFINGVPFAIAVNNVAGKQYRYARFNVESLMMALKKWS